MSRSEFTMKTKQAAWQRANGICECGCGVPFGKGKDRPDYDHRQPCALGGDNSLDNCKVIRHSCHVAKTSSTDIKRIAKARRGEKEQRGMKAKRSSFQTSRDGPFKAKIGGGIVPR